MGSPAPSGFSTTRLFRSIRYAEQVQADPALRRCAGLDSLDIGGVMGAPDLVVAGSGRLGAWQPGVGAGGQHPIDGLDPRHPLRMAGWRDMGMAGRVVEDQNGHGGRLAGWVGEVNARIQRSIKHKRLPRPLDATGIPAGDASGNAGSRLYIGRP